MKSMDSLMAVHQDSEGIIGKFFYYSTSSILIPKVKFIEIGQAFGLPKFKPAKESKAGAYRNATTALRERVTVKDADGRTHVYRIYCRDNKKDDARLIVRELVKETPNAKTNEYKKLANICFDRENEVLGQNRLFRRAESTEISVDCSAYDEFLGAHHRKERSEEESYFISADR